MSHYLYRFTLTTKIVPAVKLGIAMTTELCYNDCAETNGKRGVLLLNAIGQHNLLLRAKRPLLGGFTSRHSSQQRWQPSGGRFVMSKKCKACEQVLSIEEFGRNKSKKDGLRTICKKCTTSRSLERYHYLMANDPDYRERRREQAKSAQRQRLQNPDYLAKLRSYRREYKKAEAYRIQEAKRKRVKRQSDPTFAERQRVSRRKSGERYRAARNESYRIRYANDPEYKATLNRRAQIYHARKTGNGGTYTEQEWIELCNLYGNICLCCKESKPLTVDHVIPVSKGGTSDISNIQPLCLGCNGGKKDRIIDYRPKATH